MQDSGVPAAGGAEPAITGILLAAGRGRRFGAAGKLLRLLRDGSTIAAAAARNLRQVLPDSIAVVRREDLELRDQLERLGLRVVTGREVENGMGASLALALHSVDPARAAVIALADMPFVAPASIADVVGALGAGAAIAAPVYSGRRGHPVGFSSRFRAELLALTEDHGARDIIARHGEALVGVPCDDPGVLIDIDTPLDLQTALQDRDHAALQ